MLYHVFSVELDLSGDACPFCDNDCPNLHSDDACDEFINYRNRMEESCEGAWEAVDGDDLVDQITSKSGYCVLNIEYQNMLR